MTLIEETPILVIGFILGITSNIITSLITEPVEKWKDRRNLKKCLEGDILLQMNHLLSMKKIITSSLGCETLGEAIDKFKKEDHNKLIISVAKGGKSSLEFYNKNYDRFLYYFEDELVFYQSVKYLNTFIEMVEEHVKNGGNPNEAWVAYCEYLEKIIIRGESISRNLSPTSYNKLWGIKSSIESNYDN